MGGVRIMLTLEEIHASHRLWEQSQQRLAVCKTESDLTALLVDDPTYPLALLWRGEMRLESGNYAAACQDFQTYLSHGASSGYFLQLLTQLLKERPKYCNLFDPYDKPYNRLAICMIVRDEEKDLPRALESVKGLWDTLIVVDTGSKDGTTAIAREYGAEVRYFKWVGDFSAARNFSLSHVDADWVFVMDADEELLPEGHEKLRGLLESPDIQAITLGWLNVYAEDNEATTPFTRIWRHHPACRYRYRIEEMIDWSILPLSVRYGRKIMVAEDIVLRHDGNMRAKREERKKPQRNLALMEDRLNEFGPSDRRGIQLFEYSLRENGRDDEAAFVRAAFGV